MIKGQDFLIFLNNRRYELLYVHCSFHSVLVPKWIKRPNYKHVEIFKLIKLRLGVDCLLWLSISRSVMNRNAQVNVILNREKLYSYAWAWKAVVAQIRNLVHGKLWILSLRQDITAGSNRSSNGNKSLQAWNVRDEHCNWIRLFVMCNRWPRLHICDRHTLMRGMPCSLRTIELPFQFWR